DLDWVADENGGISLGGTVQTTSPGATTSEPGATTTGTGTATTAATTTTGTGVTTAATTTAGTGVTTAATTTTGTGMTTTPTTTTTGTGTGGTTTPDTTTVTGGTTTSPSTTTVTGGTTTSPSTTTDGGTTATGGTTTSPSTTTDGGTVTTAVTTTTDNGVTTTGGTTTTVTTTTTVSTTAVTTAATTAVTTVATTPATTTTTQGSYISPVPIPRYTGTPARVLALDLNLSSLDHDTLASATVQITLAAGGSRRLWLFTDIGNSLGTYWQNITRANMNSNSPIIRSTELGAGDNSATFELPLSMLYGNGSFATKLYLVGTTQFSLAQCEGAGAAGTNVVRPPANNSSSSDAWRLDITDSVTNATFTPNIAAVEIPVKIYDMQNDAELFLFDSNGSTSSSEPVRVSAHPIIGSSGGVRRVDMAWAGDRHTITVDTRGGTSQRVDIKLAGLTTRPNHSYRFTFSGALGTEGTDNTLWIRTSAGTATTLASQSVVAGGSFTISHTATTAAIQAFLTAYPTQTFGLGGVSQRDITVNDLTITALCPPDCTSCVAMPPIPTVPTPSGSISSSLTAATLVNRMTIGWNLGNTFDCHSEGSALGYGITGNYSVTRLETSWLSHAHNTTTRAFIQEIAKEFNTIRIPVTWYKAAGPAPTHTIRADYMKRVKQVVDWAMAENMIVILNTHHENSVISLTDDASQSTHAGRQYLTAIWGQIANEFRDYPENLIFEGLNEPRNEDENNQWDGGSSTTQNNVNRLNQAFVDTVRATGGNNQSRILMVPTVAASAAQNALSAFTKPTDSGNTTVNKIAMSIHAYEPFDWAHNGVGNSYPSNGNTRINDALNRVQTRASALGIPVVLGEFGSVRHADDGEVSSTRDSARATHAREYVAAATQRGMRAVWWDTGRTPDHERGDAFTLITRRAPYAVRHQNIINAMKTGRG
ncbi:MAG: glycoside hydrolase family 5 protein, partial [Oscillospiraceae bacterium]|nr:glycoside hydrolase family 5 protein [Oscillospiraceae bacterium]